MRDDDITGAAVQAIIDKLDRINEGVSNMRADNITAEDVQAVADKIEALTEGRFRAPMVARPGDGVNFIDSNRIVSWRGVYRAMAYYLAILFKIDPEGTRRGPFNDFFKVLLDRRIDGDSSLTEPFERGSEDAHYYV